MLQAKQVIGHCYAMPRHCAQFPYILGNLRMTILILKLFIH